MCNCVYIIIDAVGEYSVYGVVCVCVWLLRSRIIFCFDDFLYSPTVYHTHHTLSTIIIKTTYFIHCFVNGNDIYAGHGTLRRESKKKENLHCRYRCPTLPSPMWDSLTVSFNFNFFNSNRFNLFRSLILSRFF